MPIAPGAGQKLNGNMFAITLHSRRKALGDRVIEALPTSWCDDEGHDPVTLLTDLTDLPAIHDSLLIWKKRAALQFFYADLMNDAMLKQLSDAASAMFRRGAAPGPEFSRSALELCFEDSFGFQRCPLVILTVAL